MWVETSRRVVEESEAQPFNYKIGISSRCESWIKYSNREDLAVLPKERVRRSHVPYDQLVIVNNFRIFGGLSVMCVRLLSCVVNCNWFCVLTLPHSVQVSRFLYEMCEIK